MSIEHKLLIRNAAGSKVAEVTDELEVAYSKRLYRPGTLAFVLKGNHAAISKLELDGQVEDWRRDQAAGIDWYCDFFGLWRGQAYETVKTDRFIAVCPGQMHILTRRVVGYAAGVANRSAFAAAKAETIMKTLVQYNATSSGDASAGNTAGGFRARAASLSGFTITIEADGAGGNTLNWNCAGDNLLDTLEKLAKVAGGDFDLIKAGAATWQFRWYIGQRGVDRSASVIFSTERDNMANPKYRFDRVDEKTVAIVGGGGNGTARTYVARTGADYAAANDLEIFVDARNDGAVTAALNARGDQKLYDTRARQAFEFEALQTKACRYGLHYSVAGGLGDLVKARYRTVSLTQKMIGVDVAFKAGRESVKPVMQNA